ncbi:MAG: hypothetical protein GEV08_21590 [Acidimicrobiia bacterium]|nr:hypothetical protein [Acidimicrobiia bacterium]
MSHAPSEPLDPVVRLHVLAAALPGAVVAERVLAAPFDRVWRVVTDLEAMTPRYERNVSAVEVVDRQGERARVIVTLRGGHSDAMDARILPGWCLMHSESTVVAFGARPMGPETVLAHLEFHRRSSVQPGGPPSDEAASKLVLELDTIELLARELDVAR